MKTRSWLKIIVVLAPAVFWIVYFAPPRNGENWYKALIWIATAGISVLSLGPVLYFAIRDRSDVIWWLILVFNLSPILAFFVCIAC